MPVNLNGLLRPTTVTIFAPDAANKNKVVAFILQQASILPVPGRVGMHLTKSVDAGLNFTISRNPMDRFVAENIQEEPEVVSVVAQLSANPLGRGPQSNIALLGAFGSIVRLDLREVERLRAIARQKEPVLLVTPARAYANMGFTSLRETHAGENKVELSLLFETMRILSPVQTAETFDGFQIGTYIVENVGGQAPRAVG